MFLIKIVWYRSMGSTGVERWVKHGMSLLTWRETCHVLGHVYPMLLEHGVYML